MVILFIGHKDAHASVDVLQAIHKEFPEATWLCGGSRGFDGEVVRFARQKGIPVETRLPNYQGLTPNQARRERNNQMVREADLVAAFYDGRPSGGTYYILTYARNQEKEIRIYPPGTGK